MNLLCIDIGGTFIKHTRIGADLQVKGTDKTPTPRDSKEHFLKTIHSLYLRYAGEGDGIDGIAICSPGVIDTDRGFMLTGGSLDYIRNDPMGEQISGLCGGIPVFIENDAKAAAAAELYSGALSDVQNGVVITIGTGIGGAVIRDRQVLRGRNLFAGEFSYMIYKEDGLQEGAFDPARCLWGLRGVPSRMLQDYRGNAGSSEEILERYRQGEEAAAEAVSRTARDIALLCHNLQCVLDPDAFAIGGGISQQTDFIDAIKAQLAQINHLFGGVVPLPQVRACRFHNDANLIGACQAFLNGKPVRRRG